MIQVKLLATMPLLYMSWSPDNLQVVPADTAVDTSSSSMGLEVRMQPAWAGWGIGFADEYEYRYFGIFNERTHLELSGYFDTKIWRRLVLQLGHSEKFVHHAVIAIGALDQTVELTRTIENALPDEAMHSALVQSRLKAARQHHDFALRQYGKALCWMKNIQTEKDYNKRLRNTVISSLLTTCFESFIGNQDNALMQAQAGLQVLREWHANARASPNYEGCLKTNFGGLEGDILNTFARLDNQVMMFQDTRSLFRPYGFHVPPAEITT